MSTLKEISQYAKVSVSTVSQVLNGRAGEMRISEETAQKVFDAATKLNYQPNMNARRLKSNTETIPTIALFWSTDISPFFLARCLDGVQRLLVDSNRKFDLVIQPFKLSTLHLSKVFTGPCPYNGIVIANASDSDMVFLHKTHFLTPIVLLNRSSEKCCCVNVSPDDIVNRLIEMLQQKGRTSLGIVRQFEQQIAINSINVADKVRRACEKVGITIKDEWVAYGEGTVEGGRSATENLLSQSDCPKTIFYCNAIMATCVVRLLWEKGIHIPKDKEIISYGGYEFFKDMVPSITTIEIPLEVMAEKCFEMLLDAIEDKPFIKKLEFTAKVNFMESFERYTGGN